MPSIDSLDAVSLLLGFALAAGVVTSLAGRWRRAQTPLLSKVLMIGGLGLLLGYAISEMVHGLEVWRG